MEVQSSVMKVLEDVEESPPVTSRWMVCNYQALDLSLQVGSSVWCLPYKYCIYLQMDSGWNSEVIDLFPSSYFLTPTQVMVPCYLLGTMFIFNPDRLAPLPCPCPVVLAFTLCGRPGLSTSECSSQL